ncbi:MAG: GHKL domain-containing protein, partial [Candidatus Latescibacteria bacterium]|nr:GHKL domain-containing protein [Candidatus Latescibacterota bacterium]
EMTRLDLNEIVPGIIDMIAAPDNIDIRIETPLPVIVAERTRIGQVFGNLLSNAVKFMDKPDGRISISCADRGGFWRFSVSDNGPGIEERYFERIFKIFQTLSPRDDFESTGVGLSLVKKIVTMYRGTVDVESTVGVGTTFYFTLPKTGEETDKENIHEYHAAHHAG